MSVSATNANSNAVADLERQFRDYSTGAIKESKLKEHVLGSLSTDDFDTQAVNVATSRSSAGKTNDLIREKFVGVLAGMFGGLDKIPPSVIGEMKLEDYGGLSAEEGNAGIARKTAAASVSTRNKRLSPTRVSTVMAAAYRELQRTSANAAWQQISQGLASGMNRQGIQKILNEYLEGLAQDGRISLPMSAGDQAKLADVAGQLVKAYGAADAREPSLLLIEEEEPVPPPAADDEAEFDLADVQDKVALRDALDRLDELVSGLSAEGKKPWKSGIAQKAGIRLSVDEQGRLLKARYERAAGQDAKAVSQMLDGTFKNMFARYLGQDTRDMLQSMLESHQLAGCLRQLPKIAEELLNPDTKAGAAKRLRACFAQCLEWAADAGMELDVRNRYQGRIDSFMLHALGVDDRPGKISAADMTKLERIAAAAIGSREGIEGGAGYMGLFALGADSYEVAKLLTHSGERKSNLADGLPEAKIASLNEATAALKDTLLRVADSCGQRAEVEKILNRGTKTFAKKGTSLAVNLVSRAAVAEALALVAGKAWNADTGIRFHWDATVARAATVENTDPGTVLWRTTLLKDHGLSAFNEELDRLANEKPGQSESAIRGFKRKLTNQRQAAINVIKRQLKDPELLRMLRELKPVSKIAPAGVPNAYDLGNLSQAYLYEQKAGGSVEVANALCAEADENTMVAISNLADMAKSGGYFDDANKTTQEETVIREFDLTFLPWLLANGLVSYDDRKDEFGNHYLLGYLGDYGTLSPLDGITYSGAVFRDEKKAGYQNVGTTYEKPVEMTLLTGATVSLTPASVSCDFKGGNSYMLLNRIETCKDGKLRKVFRRRPGGVLSKEAEQMQRTSYQFIAKGYQDIQKAYDGYGLRDQFRKVMTVMLFSGENRHFDVFGETEAEVARFKQLIGYDESLQQDWQLLKDLEDARSKPNDPQVMAKGIVADNDKELELRASIKERLAAGTQQLDELYEQALVNYKTTQKAVFAKWILSSKAAMEKAGKTKCRQITGPAGCGAFNCDPVAVAECMAEMAVLLGGDWLTMTFPDFDGKFEKLFRAAFVKYSAIYGVPWSGKGDSMTLEDAQAYLAGTKKPTDQLSEESQATGGRRFNVADSEILAQWRQEMEARREADRPKLADLRQKWAEFDQQLKRDFPA